jgi:hypothetical protein
VKENKMYILWLAFREEANADKIYNRLSALGYKSELQSTNTVSILLFMAVMLLMLKKQ